eukprot:6176383-Pleurochrysis_carterae.AAC.2
MCGEGVQEQGINEVGIRICQGVQAGHRSQKRGDSEDSKSKCDPDIATCASFNPPCCSDCCCAPITSWYETRMSSASIAACAAKASVPSWRRSERGAERTTQSQRRRATRAKPISATRVRVDALVM